MPLLRMVQGVAMKEVGRFNIASGAVRMSDPCYDTGVWCAGDVEKVKNGEWTAFIREENLEGWGRRNAELHVYSKGRGPTSKLTWTPVGFEVGVDSGQAGIFDADKYRKNEAVLDSDLPARTQENDYAFRIMDGTIGVGKSDDGRFYGACCAVTAAEPAAGVLNFGALSSSGIGDGGYDGFVARNSRGVAVALKIVFLTDEPPADE